MFEHVYALRLSSVSVQTEAKLDNSMSVSPQASVWSWFCPEQKRTHCSLWFW
jgi:hypothetical protein